MGARRCALLSAACALLALTGCFGGGDDPEPTAAELEAAHERWRDRVDDICFEVNRAVGRRGQPDDVDDTGSTVAQGIEDVRDGIRRIVAVPLASGGDDEPAAFVRELEGFDAEIAALPGGGADMEPAALADAAHRLRPLLRRLEGRAGEAGLTQCLSRNEREVVPDGVRRPLFHAQLERHERRHISRLPRLGGPPASAAVLANRIGALGDAFDRLVADAAAFEPPGDAAKATGLYVAAARRLLTQTRRLEAYVRGGGATSPVGFRRQRRAFDRAWEETAHAHGRMQSRAGLL